MAGLFMDQRIFYALLKAMITALTYSPWGIRAFPTHSNWLYSQGQKWKDFYARKESQ